jgi:hypothetical protein
MISNKKFNSLTVIELKEKIKSLGGSGHSKYNKEELIVILQNLTNQLNNNSIYNFNNFNDQTTYNIFHSGYHIDSLLWKKELLQQGWSVIQIPKFDPSFWKNSILHKIQNINNNSIRNIISDDNLFVDDCYNIHNLCHDQIIWDLRNHCKIIFQKIWKDNNLLCSFESPFILRSNVTNLPHLQLQKNQNHNLNDFISVEGLILFNNDSNSGLLLKLGSDNKLYKISSSSENMFIFDSRLERSIVKPSIKYVLGMKICMQPQSGATQEELLRRNQYLSDKSITSNWCYGPLFNKL